MNCLRAGHVKLDYVLKEKQLEPHPTKSGFLIFGSEGFKAKAKQDAQEKPLMLGDIEVKEKKTDSYLGDKLCSEGLRAERQK